uniref:Myosin-binding protein 7 n=1 Tax=Rhizophora mucronata TaxID=61149 RepID=A0A2P2KGE1_RHIMU
MELEVLSPSSIKCCNCGCSCSLAIRSSSTGSWLRSVKRKYNEFEECNRFFIPGFDLFPNPRVEVENECAALREVVGSQQLSIQDLYSELEEERNASSSAANEAMSMIIRLQREKAEIQMEARQFKRFAEEKMAHDQQEILALEDMLYKREQVIQSLTCEVQAYKHRMLSFGLTEAEVEGEVERMEIGFGRNPSMSENLDSPFDFLAYNYPPLKCNVNEDPALESNDDVDVEKYASGETPHGRDHLKNLDYRICQMERSPSGSQLDGEFSGTKNTQEKVIVGHSPRWPGHRRRFSTDSSGSLTGMSREGVPDFARESPRFKSDNSFRKADCVQQTEENLNLGNMGNASEFGDDTNDRVYTIDSVHNGASHTGGMETKAGTGMYEDYTSTPRDTLNQPDVSDPDIKKLYMRLQALEADRESMRQAILSMQTDKAQLVLLKEIAQHLCKEVSPERPMPVKNPSILGSFSFLSMFKWITSFVFWRKKARRSKYMYGLRASNAGLRMLLDKGPRTRQWRCLTRTRVRNY